MSIFSNPIMTLSLTIINYIIRVGQKNITDANGIKIISEIDILIFAKGKTTYNPIMEERGKPRKKGGYVGGNKGTYGSHKEDIKFNNEYYPTSIIEISNANQKAKQHPTEKPLDLMLYLVKTYTDETDLVLDNTMGSGTTCVAAKELNRKFIGIEKEPKYYEIACQRCGF